MRDQDQILKFDHGFDVLFQSGDETCVPFLVSRYTKDLKAILRSDFKSNDEVLEWISERIIESNLHQALVALTSCPSSIVSHYDSHACMRNKHGVKSLLRGIKLLDEQDLIGLAELQLDKTVIFS